MERINHFLNSLMLFMHTHYYTFIHKLFTFCTIGILNLLICLQSKLLTAFTDCVLQNPQNSGLTAKTVPWIFRPLYVRHTLKWPTLVMQQRVGSITILVGCAYFCPGLDTGSPDLSYKCLSLAGILLWPLCIVYGIPASRPLYIYLLYVVHMDTEWLLIEQIKLLRSYVLMSVQI